MKTVNTLKLLKNKETPPAILNSQFSIVNSILIAPIRFYQRHISSNTRRHCRFMPTCSQYAIEAIEEWGAFRGFFLALYRLLRCNPFCKSGYDPVPRNRRQKTEDRGQKDQANTTN